jgi:hypothetical protein
VGWAIEKGVHIILISWMTRKKSTELYKAIKRAAKSNVLVFCSAADTGTNYGKVWPADYPETVSVSASDIYGRPSPQSREKADLLVDSGNMVADGPAHTKKDTIGPVYGSSVATALVAGIASLGLTLAQLANDDPKVYSKPHSKGKLPPSKRFQNKKMILKFFNLMREKEHGSLQPSKLFVDCFLEKSTGNGSSRDTSKEPPPIALWIEKLKIKNFEDTTEASDESEGEDETSD